jgi:hypothetical protein
MQKTTIRWQQRLINYEKQYGELFSQFLSQMQSLYQKPRASATFP